MTSLPPKATPGKIVPAMPPLDGVKDPAARAALRAIIDSHQVRNGFKGTGENRFITEADLGNLGVLTSGAFGLNLAGGPTNPRVGNNGGVPRVGQINNLLNQLAARIYESPLFKFLGQQIDGFNIDLSLVRSRVEGAITGLGTKIDERINANEALLRVTSQQFVQVQLNLAVAYNWVQTNANTFASQVQQVTGIEARIGNPSDPANPNGGLYARLQQESLVRANKDGELYGQYTVKIDNKGYVAGFGLANTRYIDGRNYSEFYIRADCFAIASPAQAPRTVIGVETDLDGNVVFDSAGNPVPRFGAPNAAAIPFIVRTDPWIDDNGVQQLPGAYIRAAFIEYAAIDTARIRDAAVDTLKIAGQAVTFPIGRDDGSRRTLGTSYQSIWFFGVNNNDKASVPFSITAVVMFEPGSGGSKNYVALEVRVDGQHQFERNIGYPNNIGSTALPLCGVFNLSPGVHGVEVRAREYGPDVVGHGDTVNTSVVIIGLKR